MSDFRGFINKDLSDLQSTSGPFARYTKNQVIDLLRSVIAFTQMPQEATALLREVLLRFWGDSPEGIDLASVIEGGAKRMHDDLNIEILYTEHRVPDKEVILHCKNSLANGKTGFMRLSIFEGELTMTPTSAADIVEAAEGHYNNLIKTLEELAK